MSATVFYAAVVACLVTLVIVMIGVIGFGTGRASASFSQRMMRYRIVAQFVAIVLIMATILLVKSGQ
jgi:hypothetical protein